MRTLGYLHINKALASTALIGLLLVGCNQNPQTPPEVVDSTVNEDVTAPAEEIIVVDPTETLDDGMTEPMAEATDTDIDSTANGVVDVDSTGTAEEQVVSQNPDQAF